MTVTSWLKAFALSQVHYGKGPTAKSKIMVFGCCELLKRYYSHFWHVDAISHCAGNGLVFDKNYSSLVSMHAQMLFPNIARAHCPESQIFANLDLYSLLGAFK